MNSGEPMYSHNECGNKPMDGKIRQGIMHWQSDYSCAEKARNIQLVEIQSEERLAATSELNSAPSLVTNCREARGMGYWAATQVKGLSSEIDMVSVVDTVNRVEDRTLITEKGIMVNLNGHEAGNGGNSQGEPTVFQLRQGYASPTESKTVARYQRDSAGTRETQSVLHKGVCKIGRAHV